MDMHVPEIRREHRQERIDRATAPIAVDERADRETMSQIVEPRIAATQSMGTKPRSHTDVGRHARKRVLSRVLRDADAALGDQERIIETLPDDPISKGLIRRQRLHRRGVPGHDPRFAEFRATDEERGLVVIEIAVIEGDDLGAAQAGHGEESKQRLVGAPTQPVRRRQLARSGQQSWDVLFATEARRASSIATWKEVGGRDFGADIS